MLESAAQRQHRAADAGLRHAGLRLDAARRRRHPRHLVGAGRLHVLPRQDRHPRLVRRLPQPVLHRRRQRRRLHQRPGHHPGAATRDQRHGRRVGLGQRLAERHPEERRQPVPRRHRWVLLGNGAMQSSNIDDDFPRLRHQFEPPRCRIFTVWVPSSAARSRRPDLVLRRRRPLGLPREPARRLLQQVARQIGAFPARRPIAFEPDLDPAGRRSFDWFRNHSLRTTWQATEKHKFAFFGDLQKSCRSTTGPFTGANAIESERGWDWWPSGVVQGTWTGAAHEQVAGRGRGVVAGGQLGRTSLQEGVSRDDRSILETSTNFRYGATSVLTAPIARTGRSAQRITAPSDVTGSHNFKAGVTLEQAFNDESRSRNNEVDGLNYDFFQRPAAAAAISGRALLPAGTAERRARHLRPGRVDDRLRDPESRHPHGLREHGVPGGRRSPPASFVPEAQGAGTQGRARVARHQPARTAWRSMSSATAAPR